MMFTEFEFLGKEEIENVITCMHHCMDKVVLFGYHDLILEYRDRTESFLVDHCGVKDVVFCEVPVGDLDGILRVMRQVIHEESGVDQEYFFDITGGEDLVLVAFGMLMQEYQAAMHYYDIRKDKLMAFPNGRGKTIEDIVPRRTCELNLETYVRMLGGLILSKSVQGLSTLMIREEFKDDADKLARISIVFAEYWTAFSALLERFTKPDRNLKVSIRKSSIQKAFLNSLPFKRHPQVFERMIKVMAEEGLLLDLQITEETYQYRIKNNMIKGCLWKAGSLLEYWVYREELAGCDDCMMSVSIDWDGHLYGEETVDVNNEIDVMTLTGNEIHLISCKSGKLSGSMALHALYELNTVAERFGGKYARKTLAVTQNIGNVYMERAKEMGIEVRMINTDVKDQLKMKWSRESGRGDQG